jgi:transketolase
MIYRYQYLKFMKIPIDQLENLARQIRFEVVKMSSSGKAAHLGSSLSCVDILVALYFSFLKIDPKDPYRDRFILSKGHAVSALYATLAYKNFFPKDALASFNKDGSALPEHPSPYCVPGLEVATGSLGHGLSFGIGHALAAKISEQNFKVAVLLSDGECNEGSVWEAAMFAPAKKLNNLIAIIDFNKWQATGRSCEVMQLQPLKEKWASFGWDAHEIDGHDIAAILKILSLKDNDRPCAIIAHTVKGKGVSFMEDDNNWHYRIPTAEEVELAQKELQV